MVRFGGPQHTSIGGAQSESEAKYSRDLLTPLYELGRIAVFIGCIGPFSLNVIAYSLSAFALTRHNGPLISRRNWPQPRKGSDSRFLALAPHCLAACREAEKYP
jgi:hypothetical protein